MWILNILPDAILHSVVILSVLALVASFVFGFIPAIEKYKLPIQVVAIIVLVFGIYLEGGLSERKAWEYKVAQVEKQVEVARADSAEANIKLVEALKENEKLRKDKKYGTQTIVNQVVSKYDGQCVLSNAFIRVHDSASQDQLPEGSRVDDGNPSNVKPSEVLNTVIDNYETCYNIRDKLIKWQEWYKTNKDIYEK